MTQDLNKGITAIRYNSLNLPRQIDIKSPVGEGRNEYLYSASGVKLQVVQRYNSNYNTAPINGTDINLTALDKKKTTDYVGNKIYEDDKLKRILVDGGYIEGGVYYFYLNDHLGNNRVVANQSGTAIQKTHYYPFGSAFAEGLGDGVQPYKYNGKELDKMHGLNMSDYSARHYDAAIGRFTTIDPLAEKYYSISPYAYCANNPIKFIDPTGMWIQDGDPNKKESFTLVITLSTAKPIVRLGLRRLIPILTLIDFAEETHKRGLEYLQRIEEKESTQPKETSDDRTKDDELRRDERTKEPKADPEAEGTDHTQLGTQEGRKGSYRQAREFDKEGKPVRDIDFTDHGRPKDHPNPHQHRYKENSTGETRSRNKKAEPLN